MYWLHCNHCFILGIDEMANNANFHVTNCGHIFCSACLIPATKPQCVVCLTPDVNSVAMDSNLSPEVEVF